MQTASPNLHGFNTGGLRQQIEVEREPVTVEAGPVLAKGGSIEDLLKGWLPASGRVDTGWRWPFNEASGLAGISAKPLPFLQQARRFSERCIHGASHSNRPRWAIGRRRN
jgi:hypothetical protein